MNTYSSSLQAFCSHGGNHLSFLTQADRIEQDINALLQEFGASRDVRIRVYETLKNKPYPFDSGFRFEEETEECGRTVVYASIPNPYIDTGKPTAHEGLRKREEERQRDERAVPSTSSPEEQERRWQPAA